PPGVGEFAAPNGSSAGRDALKVSINAGDACIDVARSSSGPRAIGSDLATFGGIPGINFTAKTPARGNVLAQIGLNSPKLPAPVKAGLAIDKPDPLANEKKALAAQRQALEDERTAWEDDRKVQEKQTSHSCMATPWRACTLRPTSSIWPSSGIWSTRTRR
ncbi:MAG: hypothetical protein LH616_07330, partial [Ilumatobacteraceae bacterium]|nr:hypothetical protein [Ilumatobacteraceae bacterium]